MTSETAEKLINRLRQMGVATEAVLAAMALVPREQFVPPPLRRRAFDNISLPIGQEQTISQPEIVAMMTQALRLDKPNLNRVLEIGTGSGYQTAILAHLVRRVYTIERHKALLDGAVERFTHLALADRIQVRLGDGTLGWPEAAPFERIIITAAAMAEIPPPILSQCAIGGIIVAPIERAAGGEQYLVRLTRHAAGLSIASPDWTHLGFPLIGNAHLGPNVVAQADFIAEEICPVRFVPLVSEQLPSSGESLSAALKRLNR
ncbi:MAG: protein-L-isoaspartate(D-aspartate) O-methyltransferase [Candidatus Symbiobacter sp.]|nr:protein-L-isoaspartate(D-aspartate) O-methyltransferase [Candidatus Symbiobacter sp.]